MLMIDSNGLKKDQTLLTTIYLQKWKPNSNGSRQYQQIRPRTAQTYRESITCLRQPFCCDNNSDIRDQSTQSTLLPSNQLQIGNTNGSKPRRRHSLNDVVMINLRKRLNIPINHVTTSRLQRVDNRQLMMSPSTSLASMCLQGNALPSRQAVRSAETRRKCREAQSKKAPEVSCDVIKKGKTTSSAMQMMKQQQVLGIFIDEDNEVIDDEDDDVIDDEDDDVIISDNESIFTDDEEEMTSEEETEWKDLEAMKIKYKDENRSLKPDEEQIITEEDPQLPYQFAEVLTSSYARFVNDVSRPRLIKRTGSNEEAVAIRLRHLKNLESLTIYQETSRRKAALSKAMEKAATRSTPNLVNNCTTRRHGKDRVDWALRASRGNNNVLERAIRDNDLTILDQNWISSRCVQIKQKIESRFQNLRKQTNDVNERKQLRHKEKKKIRNALSRLYNYSWSEKTMAGRAVSALGVWMSRGKNFNQSRSSVKKPSSASKSTTSLNRVSSDENKQKMLKSSLKRVKRPKSRQ